MHDLSEQQREAWRKVSEQNLQAAVEALLRATSGDTDYTRQTVEQTVNRVIDDHTWRTQ